MSASSARLAAPRTGSVQPGTSSPRLTSGRGVPGPRLLLPPRTDATPAMPLPLPLPGAPVVRSVLSPVTEARWPVAAPVRPVEPVVLPDPTRLCGAVVLAAVEVLGGTRPLVQLTRWVSPEVLEALTAATRRGSAPGRGSEAAQPSGQPGRATVRRTHLFRVSDTAAEASVVVHDAGRVRAAAVRLEVHRGHWRATVLQIG